MNDSTEFSADDAIKLQMDRYTQIQKTLTNYKKDSTSRKNRIYYELRIKKISDLYHKFSELHEIIVCNIGAENTYFTKEVLSLFEEAYVAAYSQITDDFERDFPPQPSSSEHTSTPTASNNLVQTQNISTIQPPNLPVPHFSGKFLDWPSFHDSFNRLFHLNLNLNAIQKFHYLKQSLPNDSDYDIKQLALTESNYTIAWDLLVKRYNNPRILFTYHMNSIYQLPIMTTEKSDSLKALLSVANVCINEFKRIEIKIEECDQWLVHMLSTKLAKETFQSWEHFWGSKPEIPKFKDFQTFLNNRLVTIDAIEHRNTYQNFSISPEIKSNNFPFKSNRPTQKRPEVKTCHIVNTGIGAQSIEKCGCCGENHITRRCDQFLKLDSQQRRTIASQSRLCFNCLSPNHMLNKCPSKHNCSQCGQRHHTLLHRPSQPATQTQKVSTEQSQVQAQTSFQTNTQFISASIRNQLHPKVLLATAIIQIVNPIDNRTLNVRALLDQGSEITIISEQVVQSLHLPRRSTCAEIIGVGHGASNKCKYTAEFVLSSLVDPEFKIFVDRSYVLDRLTSKLPTQSIQPEDWSHIHHLTLADPTYFKPSQIDMIIGADIYAQIILPDVRIGSPNQPIAQNTHLGWILSGKTQSNESPADCITCNHTSLEFTTIIQKFFELESVPNDSPISSEDKWCEEHFKQTHQRQSNGKYMVRLPLKTLYDPNITLGRSKQMASNRFFQLHRRLQRNEELKNRYSAAIQEYFDLNQIVPASSSEGQHLTVTSANKPTFTSCVLAHHAIIKEESLTTKVRVVFDASARTSNGRSLNDNLCIGPVLQNNLPAIIMNWRLYPFVFIADIQKMYRCIDMHPEDAQYQRILWYDKNNEIQEFCLTTVTFGTASAPYDAIRVIHQLADDEKQNYPLAEYVLKHEMYVDDIQTGAYTIEEAIQLRDQINSALLSGHFELRKWCSNKPEILQSIPKEHCTMDTTHQFDKNESIKTLGVRWNPNLDIFGFQFDFETNIIPTKRNVSSLAARIYDPLGHISPVTITAKIILKSIWSTKIERATGQTTGIEWDEELPLNLQKQWQTYIKSLDHIQSITIPRWIEFIKEYKNIQLHAFCDGSTSAYAACIYLRIEFMDESIKTHLVVAKTKVTPINVSTIPRIELSGAVLATKLMVWVKQHLRVMSKNVKTYFWSDATIVLHWIHGNVNRWKPFVANRITFILENSSPSEWNHVNTDDNPADCATRGLSPAELAKFNLWWIGPKWLSQSPENWQLFNKNSIKINDELIEAKPTKLLVNQLKIYQSFIYEFSSFTKLQRITAIVLRFLRNCRIPSKLKFIRQTGSITVAELRFALFTIVKCVQNHTFSKELNLLAENSPLPHGNKLSGLSPFIDGHGILRARGRLQRSNLSYDRKHPMILTNDNQFTSLFIDFAHLTTLHGGTTITTSYIQQTFWIMKSRRTVMLRLRKCVKCFRMKPKISSQLMGNLPAQRINPSSRPFISTGIDYAGPIEIKASRYRGNTTYKGYIAIFICLATKAIHLEVVTGLDTKHFLWALQRFIGRRGCCYELFSDNGTNFIGAEKVLNVQLKQFQQAIEDEIVPKLAVQGIQWHFNPPHSPNFGGLWEANVKSVKFHLKRICDSTHLTFEELNTVLVRIESCLNSRPICPLTSDIDDLACLTPGHFLIGDALLSLPEPPLPESSLKSQYFAKERMLKSFWDTWRNDWLSHLQTRPKWRQIEQNLKINDIVIIKDDRLPPNNWLLGKVTEIYPASDGLVRVVSVKTKHNTYKRSVSKLCKLPFEHEEVSVSN